jgi:phosphomannomutase/phosphoglucomutase
MQPQLAQLVTSLGGRPVLWKTGHALMKQKMAETGALLGGEFSGHIFFGERWFGFDDGMYATGRLAEILSSEENSLDELIRGTAVGREHAGDSRPGLRRREVQG